MHKRGQFSKNAKPDSVKQRKYNSKPQQKKNRAERNAARAEMMKEGKAHKGDGKDVGHYKGLMEGGSNSRSNYRMQDRKKNRLDGARLGGHRR